MKPQATIAASLILLIATATAPADVEQSLTIDLPIPGPANDDDSTGGILVADVNGNDKPDFLVTCQAHLAVHDNSGKRLWGKKGDIGVGGQAESQGLPGHHGPGVAAGDVDDDGKCEVVYLSQDGTIHFVDGATGKQKATAKPKHPNGAKRWELAMIADFRGTGKDTDLLLQATNADGYRTGRYLAAYTYNDLVADKKPLWTTNDFISCAHNGARLADLNDDGRDEVLGATIYSPDGKLITRAADFKGHMDSVFFTDVRPDLPGLEVVLLEEGSNYVQLLGMGGPIWRSDFRRQEPQNAAVGRFEDGSDEVFLWCRSRYPEHQKPFVFNSHGKKIFDYAMDDVAPKGWTTSGVEVIHTIDWTGKRTQLACAKERHKSGDVCLFEPLTGRFVERIKQKAGRLYVADVRGDWREEILVLSGNKLTIYENPATNPRPDRPRLWNDRNYRRRKQCHNYYSP